MLHSAFTMKSGILISKKQAVFTLIFFAIALTTVGLMSGLVSKRHCHAADDQEGTKNGGGHVNGQVNGGHVNGQVNGRGQMNGQENGGHVNGEENGRGQMHGQENGGHDNGQENGRGQMNGQENGGHVNGQENGGHVNGQENGGQGDGQREGQSDDMAVIVMGEANTTMENPTVISRRPIVITKNPKVTDRKGVNTMELETNATAKESGVITRGRLTTTIKHIPRTTEGEGMLTTEDDGILTTGSKEILTTAAEEISTAETEEILTSESEDILSSEGKNILSTEHSTIITESYSANSGDALISNATQTSSYSSTPVPEVKGPWQDPFLPDNLLPVHYDIWVHPDFYHEGSTFYGHVNITINITQSTQYLVVHSLLLNISGTTVWQTNGQKLSVQATWQYSPHQYWVVEMKERLFGGSSVILKMDFSGSLLNGIHGVFKDSYTNVMTGTQSWYVATMLQPTFARMAFPCFDEPRYKTTFSITLRHWANFTALSNMPTQREDILDEVFQETVFEKSPRMSSYSVAYVICDYEYRENWLYSGTLHRIWAAPARIEEVEYALQVGKLAADWLEDTLQMSYSLPKLDQVALPGLTSAMENWGLVAYREDTLLLHDAGNEPVQHQDNIAFTVAHEMAHNYFGNLVTCHWWSDLWLNEGFARFYQYKIIQDIETEWYAIDYIYIRTVQDAMRLDSRDISRPIISEVTTPQESKAMFNTLTFEKGASILRMLEDAIGEERFTKAVTNYLKTHKFGTVISLDLWDAIQQVVGLELDIATIMRDWTGQRGYPVVDISVEDGQITATAHRFLINPDSKKDLPHYGYEWYIPLTYKTPSYEKTTKWLNKTQVTFPDPRYSGEWIKFNVKQAGFYRVNYTPDMWKQLSDILHTYPETLDAVERSGLLDDAFSLAQSCHLDYSVVLHMASYLTSEMHYFPWHTAKSALDYISKMMSTTPHYGLWMKYVRNLTTNAIKTLRVEDSGDHLEHLLRVDIVSLACGASNPVCLALVTQMFSHWLSDPIHIPVPASLRHVVYSVGLHYSWEEEEKTWNTLWSRYVNATSSHDRRALLDALSQTRQIWLIQRYLEYCWDTTKIHTSEFFRAIESLATNPIATAPLWDWTRQNYLQLIDRFGENNKEVDKMVSTVVSGFNTEFQLQQVEHFFSKYPDSVSRTRLREQVLWTIRTNILWVSRNQQHIIDWLQTHVYHIYT